MRLHMSSPWAFQGDTRHAWSVMFSLSGATDLDHADLDATAIDLFAPIAMLTNNTTYFDTWQYYPSGATVASDTGTYPTGTHRGTAAAYSGFSIPQQLEVCALGICPVGKSSKGRTVYLRKWIHGVSGNIAGDSTGGWTMAASSIFAKWDSGSGPNNLVPVDPTDGNQGTGWQLPAHMYTRQLRRGPKHQPAGTDTNDVPIPPV
jgi:hypothetical protein